MPDCDWSRSGRAGNERRIRHPEELYAGDADVFTEEDDRYERAGLGSVEGRSRRCSPQHKRWIGISN